MKRPADPAKSRYLSEMSLLCLLLMLIALGCKDKPGELTALIAPIEIQKETARAAATAAEPAGEVFEMEEVSVFELASPMAFQFQRGQPARQCGTEPSKKVKAYPQFKSAKPFYGKAMFDMSLVQYGFGINYCFAVDESGGTGTGYDRFYFDANRDLDLTNDGVLSPMENPPAQLARKNRPNQQEVAFDYLEFDLYRGPGKASAPVKVIPRFRLMSTHPMTSFAMPTARKGKIKLGSKECDVILSQSLTITGSYASPVAGVFMGETPSALPFMCGWRNVDGKFYTLSSTTSGDKLTVTPYTGPYGTLEVATGGREAKKGKVELGYLVGDNAMIDIGKCSAVDGQLMIPVGDYRPIRLGLRFGDLRVGLGMAMPTDGEMPSEPPTFAIKIRKDRPCVVNLASKPEVVFRTPAAEERIKVGSEIKVEAIVYDPGMDASLASLEDATKKVGQSIKMPDGTEYQRYQSIDPTVEITNSAGERVAEGKMPFG